jgi:hypothetical protein
MSNIFTSRYTFTAYSYANVHENFTRTISWSLNVRANKNANANISSAGQSSDSDAIDKEQLVQSYAASLNGCVKRAAIIHATKRRNNC